MCTHCAMSTKLPQSLYQHMAKEHPADRYEELHMGGGMFLVATVKNFTQTRK